MAVRRPLYIDDNNLREMSDSQISDLVNMTYYQYLEDPSVILSVVGSGGNLGNITDTRLIAGAFKTRRDRYPKESETQEPQVLNIAYQRVNQNFDAALEVEDTSNLAFPAYYTTEGDIRAMSVQDVYDTIISPAVTDLTAGDDIYSISSSQSKSGYDLVSTTPIFRDSGTDKSEYSGDIPQTADQPLDDFLDQFYLFKRNVSGASYSFTAPVKLTAESAVTGELAQYEDETFEELFKNLVRYAARDVTGLKIRYSWNGSGNNSGSLTDKRLNGSGNYQTQFVNGNDYRAQEWPNGSRVVAQTHVLRVRID